MKKLYTEKKENLRTRLSRLLLNFFPAYHCSGGRVIFISDDWKEVQVKLRLKFITRNYVGTVFGGSIYAALDPIFMIQLIKILGNKYVVWDKSAEIKFIKPISKKVFARFFIKNETIDFIKNKISENKETEIELPVYFEDFEDKKYAFSLKKLYIADKEFYNSKKNQKINWQ
jgi:hypothetical protein